MKIIHTGDVHLGSAMRNLPPDKARLRKEEIIDGFRRLCAYAKAQGVAAVLIAGDLFDGNTPTTSLKKEVFSMIAEAKPACFFYVSGNHDDEFSYSEALPENLYLFSQNHGWKSYDLSENVTITGLDSKYLDEGKYKELSLKKDRFNIVVLHGDISQGERKNTETISLRRLQNNHIDYLALGHIHIPTLTAERLDSRGTYRYCGCLEGRGFDECGKKGFFLLNVADGKLESETFLSFSKRELIEIRVDISACNTYYDVERTAFSALQNVKRENVVRLILVGQHTAGLKKDLPLLSHRLCENFFFVKISDESRVFIDYAAFLNDLSERGEFVREVGRYEMNEEIRSEIIDVGLKALAGEEIDL